MTKFVVNITEEMKENLRSEAQIRGQTINSMIRQILWDWCKNKK